MAGDDETTTTTTKAAGQQQQQKQQWWGTLEELLLVCAVNRHGTKSWDSIAMEVQNRSSTMSSLTPKNCEDKFHDLTRRFGFPSQDDAESGGGGFLVVPALVDQLRRIRVQELRAEVQRRDVSIVSLEMKVKRLEEERERSEKADADLERKTKASAEIIAGKSSAVQADSDERENRSFNESNSMTQKPETTTNKGQNDTIVLDAEEREPTKVKPEPEAETGPVLDEPDPDRDRDWSSNGKLNGTGNVKDDDENDKTTSDGEIKNNKTSGAGGLCESNELWDESKGEGKEAGLRVAAAAAAPKQSSDVQSSASLSKTIRRGGVAGCSSSEEVSPATKKVLAVKSEPLIGLLAMIRSHRLGSHFERRLRSQESERYKKLVKQHIDLRTIQSRLDRGLYSKCFQRFYRDLLLLFNNFIIFFKKTSHEHAAAQELRALVVKEMTEQLRKPKLEPEPELELPPVLLPKPSRGSTMVACGRRSSVKALSENASRKEKEKPKVNEKKVGGSSLGVVDKGVKKRRSNERSVSGPRNSRSGGNNNRSNKKGGGGGGGGGGEVKHQYGNNELSSHDGLDAKLDKKEISMKRRGAASFLRRMKQNSPKKMAEESDEEEDDEDDDDNEDDEDDKDSEEDESKDSRVEEEETKKKRGRNNNNNSKKNKKKKKRDVRRERVTRSSSNSRGRGGGGGGGEREESGKSGRKMVGRPPKRSGVALAGERKRGRDNGESEVGGVGGGGKSARKRTRR